MVATAPLRPPSEGVKHMQGKTVLVTGANQGIGKATAIALARKGARVVIVARNPDKGRAALAEVQAASPSRDAELIVADLSSQAEVRRLASRVPVAAPASRRPRQQRRGARPRAAHHDRRRRGDLRGQPPGAHAADPRAHGPAQGERPRAGGHRELRGAPRRAHALGRPAVSDRQVPRRSRPTGSPSSRTSCSPTSSRGGSRAPA